MLLLFLAGLLVIPLVTLFLAFLTAADDFWDIIRFRIGFGKLFGSLIHIVFIFGVGFIFFVADAFMLVAHL